MEGERVNGGDESEGLHIHTQNRTKTPLAIALSGIGRVCETGTQKKPTQKRAGGVA
jgi:hypothetical protein